MSLETHRRVFLARNDPRRQTPSIGICSHTRDRFGISYAQPILLNERQAGAAIEGGGAATSASRPPSSPSIPMATPTRRNGLRPRGGV